MKQRKFLAVILVTLFAVTSAFTSRRAHFSQVAFIDNATPCSQVSVPNSPTCSITNSGLPCLVSGLPAYSNSSDCGKQNGLNVYKQTP